MVALPLASVVAQLQHQNVLLEARVRDRTRELEAAEASILAQRDELSAVVARLAAALQDYRGHRALT